MISKIITSIGLIVSSVFAPWSSLPLEVKTNQLESLRRDVVQFNALKELAEYVDRISLKTGTILPEKVVSVASRALGAADDRFRLVGGGKYRLSASIATTDTSITLQSLTLPVSGTEIAMSDFGDIGYATLEPGTSRQEFISFTGITQSGSDTTATLTGVTRGLTPNYAYAANSSYRQSHAGGSVVIFSNPPQLYDNFTSKENKETIHNVWSFETGPVFFSSSTPYFNSAPTFSSSTQIATKGYVDGIAFAAAPDAASTTPGIVQVAEPAMIASGSPAEVQGTSSPQAVTTLHTNENPTACQGDATSTYCIPVTRDNGYLDSGWFSFSTTTFSPYDDANIDSLAVNGGLLVGATTTTGNLYATSSIRVDGGLICTGTDTCFPIANIPSASTTQSLDIFTATSAPGTWTKPSGALRVEVILIGAGGGGGSGARRTATDNKYGGSGGGGGSFITATFNAALLGATESVTIGTGGAGGAAVTVDATNGNTGTVGGTTSFGSHVRAVGGGPGRGGTTAAPAAGESGLAGDLYNATTTSAGGIGGVDSGATTGQDTTLVFAPRGGGGGGGANSSDVSGAGATGGGFVAGDIIAAAVTGGAAGADPGGIGRNGTSRANKDWRGGAGGGGGGGTGSGEGAAGAGGDGGLYGAGGGGGGASNNSANSGAGGNGADGIAIVITYF